MLPEIVLTVLIWPVLAVPGAPPTSADSTRPPVAARRPAFTSPLEVRAIVVSAKRNGKPYDSSRPKFGDYGPLIKATSQRVLFECKITAVDNNSLRIPLQSGNRFQVMGEFDLPFRIRKLCLRPGMRFRLQLTAWELKAVAKDAKYVPTGIVFGDEVIMPAGVQLNRRLDLRQIEERLPRLPKSQRRALNPLSF